MRIEIPGLKASRATEEIEEQPAIVQSENRHIAFERRPNKRSAMRLDERDGLKREELAPRILLHKPAQMALQIDSGVAGRGRGDGQALKFVQLRQREQR